MYRRLGDGVLRTGEPIELGVVDAPDPDWVDRLRPFLSHKGPDYGYHVEQALQADLDGLRTHFYVGLVAGELATHVMVAHAAGRGIFAHVYTAPPWRRRGAFGQLMAAQMADLPRLGVSRLVLGTGYGGVAYRIYHSFGFRSRVPGGGDMLWTAAAGDASDSADSADQATAATATVAELSWRDWPGYTDVATGPPAPGEPVPRSPLLGVGTRGNCETALVQRLHALRASPGTAQSLVLRADDGGVAGWCHLGRSSLPVAGRLLDLHVVPGFEPHLPALLAGLAWPPEPVAFLASPAGEAYGEALGAFGLQPVATLPELADGDELRVWLRRRSR